LANQLGREALVFGNLGDLLCDNAFTSGFYLSHSILSQR
jgi:hypothetical protein